MAGNLSSYAQSGLLSHLFRTDTFAKPGCVAIALTANVPVNTDQYLTNAPELANTGSYARQSGTEGNAHWSYTITNGSGTIQNLDTYTWPVATANWGYISGAAIMDTTAYGTGNMILSGALATPKLIGNGDQFKMNPGDITFYLD